MPKIQIKRASTLPTTLKHGELFLKDDNGTSAVQLYIKDYGTAASYPTLISSAIQSGTSGTAGTLSALGSMFINTVTNKAYICTGSTWIELTGTSGTSGTSGS